MAKKLYPDDTIDKTDVSLKKVEKGLSRFQQKLPVELQKTFNRVHDSVLEKLLKSYAAELAVDSPKIRQELIIIIIMCICYVKEKTTSERTIKKLDAIHKIALGKLQRKLRALRRAQSVRLRSLCSLRRDIRPSTHT